MLFSFCRTADCITTRETRIYPCHRPRHWCVNLLGLWNKNIWSSRWCDNHVYMYTVSSPPHCIVYMSHCHCWWQCWSAYICCGSFHEYIHVGRLVSIVSLIVWHIAAAPRLARFDGSFVISIEYFYVQFFVVFLKLRQRCRKSYASLGPRYFVLLLASIDDDDDRFPVLLVPVTRFMW